MTRKCYRSAYAKFRCGVAPIKIESCTYCLNRVPVEQRLCDECNLIEDECHVLMVCTVYISIHIDAMNAVSVIDYQFSTYKHQQSGHFQIKIFFPPCQILATPLGGVPRWYLLSPTRQCQEAHQNY